MTEKEYLFMLSHTTGVGAVTLYKWKHYFQTFQAIWESGEKTRLQSHLFTEKQLGAFYECKKHESQYRKEYERLLDDKIQYVTYMEETYPTRLQSFKNKPVGLFMKGKLPADEAPTVAIVGARNCTLYGKETAEFLAGKLAGAGISVISGLALGVDSAAHRGCLAAGGETYAVLGCGVNVCYPRENIHLFRDVEEHGGIISEFLPGTMPIPMNFPMRNRIISGLADAVIITEAREKSGSLITGDLALEQGKEVFAVPGRMGDPLSAGCNRLIQAGASLCLGVEDVIEFFGMKYRKPLEEYKISEKRLAKKEKLVYSFLDSRPKSLEELVAFCQISVPEAMESLMELEMKGLIRCEGNQYYCRKM